MSLVSRRTFAAALVSLPFLPASGRAEPPLPKMTMTKDPSCSCCGSWANYLRQNGFTVDVDVNSNMDRVKTALGVPESLWSCHTAEIGGYVVEGHVAADVIRRMLAERPRAIGIAVAGMPQSAPGMDVAGAADIYDVALFDASAQRRYARFQGLREVP